MKHNMAKVTSIYTLNSASLCNYSLIIIFRFSECIIFLVLWMSDYSFWQTHAGDETECILWSPSAFDLRHLAMFFVLVCPLKNSDEGIVRFDAVVLGELRES